MDEEAPDGEDVAHKPMMLLQTRHLPTSMAGMALLGVLPPAAAVVGAALVEAEEAVADVAAMLPPLRNLPIRFRI